MSRPCRHITKYGSFHIHRCAVTAGVLKTLPLYAMRANSPERHVPSVLASGLRRRTGRIPVAISSHDVSVTQRVAEPLHSPWSSASCAAECVQRSPHRVSTKERFSDKASRPDLLSFKPRQADSLRASASYTPRESSTNALGISDERPRKGECS